MQDENDKEEGGAGSKKTKQKHTKKDPLGTPYVMRKTKPSIPLVEDKPHPKEVTILVKSVQPFKNIYIHQDPTQIADVPDPNRVVEVDGRKYYPHTYSATVKIWTVTVSGVDLNGEAFLYTKRFSTTTTSNGSI